MQAGAEAWAELGNIDHFDYAIHSLSLNLSLSVSSSMCLTPLNRIASLFKYYSHVTVYCLHVDAVCDICKTPPNLEDV